MVDEQTPEEQVANIRAEIEARKAEIASARASRQSFPTQAQARAGGLASLPMREQAIRLRRAQDTTINSYESSLLSSETQFEDEISRSLPEVAQPQLVELRFDEVMRLLTSKIEDLKNQISTMQEEKKSWVNPDDKRQDYWSRRMEILQAKKGVYDEAITENKFSVIKKGLSGYYDNLANYKAEKINDQYSRAEARREARAQAVQQQKLQDEQFKKLGFAGSVQEITVKDGKDVVTGIKTFGMPVSNPLYEGQFSETYKFDNPIQLGQGDQLKFLQSQDGQFKGFGVETTALTSVPVLTAQTIPAPTYPTNAINWTNIMQQTGLDTIPKVWNIAKTGLIDFDNKFLHAGETLKSAGGKFDRVLMMTKFRDTTLKPVRWAQEKVVSAIPEPDKTFQQKEIERKIKNLEILYNSGNEGVASQLNYLYNYQYRLEEQRQNQPIMAMSSFLKAGASSPFDVSAQAIGLLTTPVQTTKQFYNDLKTIPPAFKYAPLTTIGSLAGTALGTYAVFEGLGGFAKALGEKTITRTPKVKAVSREISIGDAVKVGINTDGSSNWVVKTGIRTKIIDKATGKVLNTIDSSSSSLAVTATSQEGAITSAVRSITASIGKKGTNIFRDGSGVVKITKKFTITTGEGLYSFIPKVTAEGDSGNVFLGTGKSKISDMGRVYLKAERGAQTTGKFVKNKVAPESSALSNIQSELVLTRELNRKIGNVDLTGTQSIFKSRILTDIYPELVRSKGWARTAKGNTLDFGFFRIGTSEARRVSPYLRRPKSSNPLITKTQIKTGLLNRDIIFSDIIETTKGSRERAGFSSQQLDISSAFEPKSAKITIGEGSGTLKTSSELLQTSKEGRVASSSLKADTSAVIKAIEKNFSKNIKKTETISQLEGAKQIIRVSPAGMSIKGLITTQTGKDEQITKESQVLSPQIKQIGGQKTTQDIRTDYLFSPIFKEVFDTTQISKNLQEQTQGSLLKQLQEQRQIPILTTPTGFNPNQQTPRHPTPNKPKPTGLELPLIPLRRPEKRGSATKKLGDLFIPIVRRKGKFKPVSRPVSFSQALAIGSSKVQRSLARTFGIKSAQTGQLVNPSIFGKTFRPSRRNSLLAVQKSKYALSSKQERDEIQLSRKRRKFKWF